MRAFFGSSIGRYVLKRQEKPVPKKCGYEMAARFKKTESDFPAVETTNNGIVFGEVNRL